MKGGRLVADEPLHSDMRQESAPVTVHPATVEDNQQVATRGNSIRADTPEATTTR
jgi:hypothetical protein